MRERHISGMSFTDANFQGRIIFLNWERFESTNHFISRFSNIVRVNAVMNRTVVDSDWRFHNLSGRNWLPHRLSRRQSLLTTVLFKTTFTWTIMLNLLILWVFLKLFLTITILSRGSRTENQKIWKGSCGPRTFIWGNYQVHMGR